MDSKRLFNGGNAPAARLRVAGFDIVPAANEIIRPDDAVENLSPLAMDVLVFLALRAGEVVTTQELMEGVWSNRVVGDNALYNVIAQLRRALDDQDRPHRVIATVARRGYRLLASVQVVEDEAPPQWPPRGLAAVLAVLVLTAAVTAAWLRPDETVGRASVSVEPHVNERINDSPRSLAHEQDQLGRYYLRQQTSQALYQAIEHFERALETDPDHAAAMTGLCDARLQLANQGRVAFAEARARCMSLLERARHLQPGLADIYAVRGAMLHWDGRRDEALADFETALRLEPDHLNALHHSAVLLHELGEVERALARHSRAATLDPLSPAIQRGIAFNLLALGDVAAARAHFQRAFDLQPGYAGVEFDRLSYQPLTRELAEAAVEWAQRNPDKLEGNPAAMVSVALTHLSMGDVHAARRHLEDAATLDPDLPYLHYGLAVLHFQEGRDNEALAAFERRAARAPERKLYRVPVALLNGLIKNPKIALSALRENYPDIAQPERLDARGFTTLKYYALFQRLAGDPGIDASLRRLRELQALCASCDAMTEAELLALENRHEEAAIRATAALSAGWVPNYELTFWGYDRNPFLALNSASLEVVVAQ